jgi:putative ABC transport system permease protein
MLGIAGSFLLRMVILSRFPTLPIQIQPNWIGHTILIAIAGALLGALYPALAAARKDPIEALAYE